MASDEKSKIARRSSFLGFGKAQNSNSIATILLDDFPSIRTSTRKHPAPHADFCSVTPTIIPCQFEARSRSPASCSPPTASCSRDAVPNKFDVHRTTVPSPTRFSSNRAPPLEVGLCNRGKTVAQHSSIRGRSAQYCARAIQLRWAHAQGRNRGLLLDLEHGSSPAHEVMRARSAGRRCPLGPLGSSSHPPRDRARRAKSEHAGLCSRYDALAFSTRLTSRGLTRSSTHQPSTS